MEADAGSILRYKQDMKIGYLRQATSYAISTLNEQFASQENPEEFLEVTSQMGLEKVARWDEERFRTLSGGEKTKLSLAHVWASRPTCLSWMSLPTTWIFTGWSGWLGR